MTNQPAPPNAPAMEIMTFRPPPSTDGTAFMGFARATEAFLCVTDAPIRRELTVDDDGHWTDVSHLALSRAAKTAARDLFASPEAKPSTSVTDGSSVNLRRASLPWQMD